jgi:hypothetical protein
VLNDDVIAHDAAGAARQLLVLSLDDALQVCVQRLARPLQQRFVFRLVVEHRDDLTVGGCEHGLTVGVVVGEVRAVTGVSEPVDADAREVVRELLRHRPPMMRMQRRSAAVVPRALERQCERRTRRRRDEHRRLAHSRLRLHVDPDCIAIAGERDDLLHDQQCRAGFEYPRSGERHVLRQQRRSAELEREQSEHAGLLQTRTGCGCAIQVGGAQHLRLVRHAPLDHFELDLRDRHIGLAIVDDRHVLQHDAAQATRRVELVRPHLCGIETDLHRLRAAESDEQAESRQ